MYIIEWVTDLTPWRIQRFETSSESEMQIVENSLIVNPLVRTVVVAQYF